MKIIFTPKIPFGFGAMTLPGRIYVRMDLFGKPIGTLIEHEKVHLKQQRSWLHFPLYLIRYFLWKPFRVRVEAEAYGKATISSAASVDTYALLILSEYGHRLGGFGPLPATKEVETMLRNAYEEVHESA